MAYILPISKTVFRQRPPPHYLDGRLFRRVGHAVSFDVESDLPDDCPGEIVHALDSLMVIKFAQVVAILIRTQVVDQDRTLYRIEAVVSQEDLLGRDWRIPVHCLGTIMNTITSIHYAELPKENE